MCAGLAAKGRAGQAMARGGGLARESWAGQGRAGFGLVLAGRGSVGLGVVTLVLDSDS